MAIKYCPGCGHELAGSGRFCLFCGCDLRKTPSVPSPDPERVSGLSGSYTVQADRKASSGFKIFLAALAAVAVALVLVFVYGRDGRIPAAVSVKEPILLSGMSFEEASAEMERCGFVKTDVSGSAVHDGARCSCNFREHNAFGETAMTITLVVDEEKDGYVALSYYFKDNQNNTGGESFLFRRLKNQLSSRHGNPEHNDHILDYYLWHVSDGYVMLSSSAGLITVFEKHGK